MTRHEHRPGLSRPGAECDDGFAVPAAGWLGTGIMIELKGVSKSYAGSMVLPKLDLTIAPGRTTVLIGPSGCGKSTLLRLMIGLVRPDTGSVLIEGDRADAATVLGAAPADRLRDPGRRPLSAPDRARQRRRALARYLGWPHDRISGPARRACRADAGSRAMASTASRPSFPAASASASA